MNSTKKTKKTPMLKIIVALLLVGAVGITVPLVMQDMELRSDAAEYEALREQTKIETTVQQLVDEPTEGAEDVSEKPAEISAPVHEHGSEPPIEENAPMEQTAETPAAEQSAAPGCGSTAQDGR